MNNMQVKKPQRTCVACRNMFDKRELIRVVRLTDGSVAVDTTGKKDGRGAYVCKNEDCINKCCKGLLKRHLKCDIPPLVYEELLKISRG